MAKKILVVEDDKSLMTALVRALEKSGYVSTGATSVEKAQEMITSENWDLVLSDMKIREKLGVDLLSWCKEKKIDCRFVFISGFSEIKNTQSALDLGADGYIPKPFSKKDLISYLKNILGEETLDDKTIEFEYCPVAIDTFLSDCEIPFHIYLKAGNKYICIAYKGEELETERIYQYKVKGIKNFYLRKNDYREFLGFLTSLSKTMEASETVPKEEKKRFLVNTGEALMNRFQVDELDSESVHEASEFVLSAVNLLADDKDIFDTMCKISDDHDYLYSHSINVSVIAVMIAKELDWKQPKTLFFVSTGAFFHDIGKITWPQKLAAGQFKTLTQLQTKLVDEHPLAGADKLRTLEGIPPEVVTIVEQHHESYDGTGRPKGLSRDKIFPIARLVNLADSFVNKINVERNSGRSKEVVLRDLATHVQNFDPKMFEALLKVFGFKPEQFNLDFKNVS